MSQKKITKEGLAELEQQLAILQQEQIANITALQEARAQGDLSENADYDAARDNQTRIAAAIKEIENNIRNAVLITADEGSNLGRFVTVQFDDEFGNEPVTYKIVGTLEADPLDEKHPKISDESPLGKAILHAKVGDDCMVKTEDGERFEVKILAIDIMNQEEVKPTSDKKARTKK